MDKTDGSRVIPIGGVRVHFPFKPYPSQLSMMAKIISGIEKQQNCLLESPTGTGKSLALLCSALAWLQAHKAKLDKEAQSKTLEIPPELDPSATCSCKCHLHVQKTCAPNPGDTSTTSGEGMSKTHSKSNLDSTDIIDDDDDFKPMQQSFRTPSAVKKRGHTSISYDDPSNQPETSTSKSTSADAWKMEITSAHGQAHAKELENPSVDDDTQCFKCECAELVRIYQERNTDKIRYPRIYYGTRTHRQLSQITKELSRTAYSGTKMTLLAAKRHTCIHPSVSRAKDVNESCRQLLDGPSCKFQEKSRSFNQRILEGTNLSNAWDLEDLIELCRDHQACPYFASRELRDGADVIFCPYNYLIDPNIRSTMEIDLSGDVLILDEAHNVEDSARSAASYEVSDKQLNTAMTEMTLLIEMNKSPEEHTNLKRMCQRILDVIEETKSSMPQSEFEVTSNTYAGNEVVIMLNKMGCSPDDVKKLKSYLNNAVSEADEHMATKKFKLTNASISVLGGLFQVLDYIYKEDNKFLPDYRLAVTRQTTYSAIEGSAAFSDLGAARAVILTSGTLAPIQTFQSELGLPFPISLEANHVINNNQVWVGVIDRGPRNRSLLANYQNSETLHFQDEVGRVILDVCQTVPHGVLCFVPSYKTLEKLKTRWLDTGIWQQMEQVKGVYCEPRSSNPESFEEIIRDYYDVIKQSEMGTSSLTGGLLFAVCRGKLSEGIDFSNNKARAVMVLGIPYPNVKDTLVNLKREYNNKHHKARGLLSGSQWYEIQAFRALNQALGRCIRHRNDWGAIILMDERFAQSERYTKGLSKWVRSKVQRFGSYREAQDSLQCFAEDRQNATSPVKAADTNSTLVDLSIDSPTVNTPLRVKSGEPDPPLSSTPKLPARNGPSRQTLAYGYASIFTPIRKPTEIVMNGTVGNSSTQDPIILIDSDNSKEETKIDEKGDGRTESKDHEESTSPLLFDSENVANESDELDKTVHYEMEVKNENALENETDNHKEEIEQSKSNVRIVAKKSAASKGADLEQTAGTSKRKSAEDDLAKGRKQLNVKRAKRRKVNESTTRKTRRKIKVLDDLCCPYCGDTLVQADRAEQIEEDAIPEFVDDLFNANSCASAYEVCSTEKCPLPDSVFLMTADAQDRTGLVDKLNGFYSEAEACCVQLLGCRNCAEGDYDRKFSLEPVGFVVRLAETDKEYLKPGKVWFVV